MGDQEEMSHQEKLVNLSKLMYTGEGESAEEEFKELLKTVSVDLVRFRKRMDNNIHPIKWRSSGEEI